MIRTLKFWSHKSLLNRASYLVVLLCYYFFNIKAPKRISLNREFYKIEAPLKFHCI